MSVPNPIQYDIPIRAFSQDDASSVEFVVLSVLQEWGFLPSAKDQQELEAMQSHNPFDAFFVAEDPDLGVVGCAGIVRVDDQTCELRKIYLLKRFRGKAIGKLLLDTCVAEAIQRGYRRMKLQVNSRITYTAPFYLRNGFVHAADEMPNNNSADQVYYKPLLH